MKHLLFVLVLMVIVVCLLFAPVNDSAETYTLYPMLNRTIWRHSVFHLDTDLNELYSVYFSEDLLEATFVTQLGQNITNLTVKLLQHYDPSTGFGAFADGTQFQAMVDSGSSAHLSFTALYQVPPGWTNGSKFLRWNYPISSYPGVPTTNPPSSNTTPPCYCSCDCSKKP